MKNYLCILSLSLCGGLGAGACSHEQTPKATTPQPAAARAERHANPPREVATNAPTESDVRDDSKSNKEQAVYFDFDSSNLRDDARPVLQKFAETAQERNARLRIEGNCDELGTTEYNLALGEQRARQAKEYLVRLGIPSARITTISYGSQRPKANGHDDQARAENRRDDLLFK